MWPSVNVRGFEICSITQIFEGNLSDKVSAWILDFRMENQLTNRASGMLSPAHIEHAGDVDTCGCLEMRLEHLVELTGDQDCTTRTIIAVSHCKSTRAVMCRSTIFERSELAWQKL